MGAMKKINVMVVLAAAVAALVSCNKEKDLVPAQNGDGIQICVTASMPDTRTVLADDGKNVNWTTSDKVGFINGEANVNVESSAAVLDGEGRATFTGTVTSEGTYYAYYPYFNDATYAPTADGVTVRVPNTQHPSLTSFDPAADLLVSEAFEVSASGSYSTNPTALRFRRLGAFLKVRFVDNTSKGKLTGKYAASVSVRVKTTWLAVSASLVPRALSIRIPATRKSLPSMNPKPSPSHLRTLGSVSCRRLLLLKAT